MTNSNSIEHVQGAEAKARKIIEDAEKRKAEKVSKANEKAGQIVEEAEAKTRQIKDDAVRKAETEAEKERSRRIMEATVAAKKVQKQELSSNKIKGVVDKVIRQIFG